MALVIHALALILAGALLGFGWVLGGALGSHKGISALIAAMIIGLLFVVLLVTHATMPF